MGKYLDSRGLITFWNKLKTYVSNYLPLSGGTLTGPVSFQSTTALPSKTLSYIVGIDAFAQGGLMGWLSKTNFLSAVAPKNSPALTGTPTAPTATAGTNNTLIATTAFVKNAIPTNVSSFTNDSKYVVDSGDSTTSVIKGYTSEDTVFTTSTGIGKGAININPIGVDIISNWSGNSNGSDDSGTNDVYIKTGAGKAYYNGDEIATLAFVQDAVSANEYCANLTTSSLANYITQPEFKSVKINGSTTNSASSNNCVLEYDTTNKCLKFVFN